MKDSFHFIVQIITVNLALNIGGEVAVNMGLDHNGYVLGLISYLVVIHIRKG